MTSDHNTTRRRFLGGATATALLGPSLVRASPGKQAIHVAFIGYGKRAYRVMGQALREKDIRVVAVCDVEGERLARAKQVVEQKYAEDIKSGVFKGCGAHVDYRELLEREDLDAVVIMTPDHMHVHPALAAVSRKLDIYCEKPLTHNIAEGRRLARAVDANKVVFQTGSQQRSEYGNRFRTAVERIWAGRIGEVRTVRVGVGGPPRPCDLPVEEQPDNVNWDLWLGPAPLRGYNHELCPQGLHSHYPDFRLFEEYAGGRLADMGAHHFDIAQWALGMDASGPVSVEPPAEGNKGLKFTYANGVEMFHGGPSGCTFEGTDGTISVDRGRLTSSREEILAPLAEDERRAQPSSNHLRNWIECIKSREQPICTVETGHRTATVCHLANIGYKVRRKLQWDPAEEQFVDDAGANALTDREPRDGWEYQT